MIEDQLKLAKLACRQMQKVDKYTKMNALDAISKGLLENIEYILAENAKDINNAKANGISSAMIDRLLLTKQRIEAMAKDVENYASLFGELQGDALLAAVLDISMDNAYQNDDRIVRALSDEFTDAQTAQEYIHSLGYETQEEYLKAMKEAIYTEGQKAAVIQKYANEESELKR